MQLSFSKKANDGGGTKQVICTVSRHRAVVGRETMEMLDRLGFVSRNMVMRRRCGRVYMARSSGSWPV